VERAGRLARRAAVTTTADPRVPGYLGRVLQRAVPVGTCFQVEIGGGAFIDALCGASLGGTDEERVVVEGRTLA
jgi:hypothetical protein